MTGASPRRPAGRAPLEHSPRFPTEAPGPRAANRKLASTAPRPVYERLTLGAPASQRPLRQAHAAHRTALTVWVSGPRTKKMKTEAVCSAALLLRTGSSAHLAGLPAGAALPSGGPRGLEPGSGITGIGACPF